VDFRTGFPAPGHRPQSSGPGQASGPGIGFDSIKSMALYNFRTYQVALEFYRACEQLSCKKHLKDQLNRASASISLNLSEGSAKTSMRDRLKFYFIAFGSLRECQTILDLIGVDKSTQTAKMADQLGAQLFTLCKSLEKQISIPKLKPDSVP
jgi:four helix bundle protein